MKNGMVVAQFEREFSAYVNARWAVAMTNGTVTLQAALVALGAETRNRVAVPPLTMSATTIAVLQCGATPVFRDVDPRTWLLKASKADARWLMPVSLYGLHAPSYDAAFTVDDAAQTLRKHGDAAFTSYSLQSSKIVSTGEGGVLVTNDENLATRVREYTSLGYRMKADEPRISSDILKSPSFKRHHSLGINGRMNDVTAEEGLKQLGEADRLLGQRRQAAAIYRDAIGGCDWITPQYVPNGWQHDYWCYSVALEHEHLWHPFVDAIEANGGERPYAAWRITYFEPAFKHLAKAGTCPIAEDLQPRLLQLQTNKLDSAERNAAAIRLAIKEIGGSI